MKSFQAQRALVTGGAGFIGSNLCARLLALGAKVRILDNFSTGQEKNLATFVKDVEVIRGDIRDANIVEKAMQGINLVFHAAALPSVPRSVKEPYLSCDVNIMGTLQVLEQARSQGVQRVIFSASSSAYGETAELPKHESLQVQPLSPYAVSKLTAEYLGTIYTRVYQVEVISLRYFNVYGPKQDPEGDYAAVIPLFIKAYLKNVAPMIYGDGEQTRDFTFVDDVVEANLQAAQSSKGCGETFNIAGGRKISINELAKVTAKVCASSVQPRHAPNRLGDIRDSFASIKRAKEFLNWEPRTSLEEGLKKTVEWFSAAILK